MKQTQRLLRCGNWNTFSGDWVKKGADLTGVTGPGLIGFLLGLSDDGTVLTFGVPSYSGNYGQFKLFKWNNTGWVELASPVTGINPNQKFGFTVGLSRDGSTVSAGALPVGGLGYVSTFRIYGVVEGSKFRLY